ncbi:MAG: peroxidase family protein [Kineosporiaceae bacterium]
MRGLGAGFLAATIAIGAGAGQAGAVTLIRSDLDFMLQQIKISENHASGAALLGDGPNQVSNPLFPHGVRTVDGRDNNLVPGQREFGAADTVFPRLVPVHLGEAQPLPFDPDGPFGPAQIGDPTSYTQTSGIVVDSRPRTISNLIVDQTANNPAAVAAAAQNDASEAVDHDNDPATPDMFVIPNHAPDEGLSAPYNSWFTFFGQFFDHGLDLVTKGGNGTVMVPLADDDPLIAGADGEIGTADDPAVVPPPHLRFMVLTRATNQPGGVHEHTNTTTSFVDQNQTYTSHPSHQVFLREYALNGAGRPVSTGRLIDDNPDGGIGSWADIKTQARDLLGIELRDADVLNVPLLLTDQYGRFLPGANGYPRLVMPGGVLVEGDPTANGGLGISTVGSERTNHAFLDDIAHHAAPRGDHDNNPATPAQNLVPDTSAGTTDDNLPGTYDDELLDLHFITGDGRGNENVGLTSVHHVFHAEHNRMVKQIKDMLLAGDPTFLAQWQISPGVWNGERLFQAARFTTEMQYQHLVFEEFARKMQPQVNVFAGYATDIDPAIMAEFAHVVYRFGHSMLNETVPRTNADGSLNDSGLIDAFLDPEAYLDGGTAGALTSDRAAGAVVRGTTRQRGNELDEFVTEALRNNLLGLPLDLPVLNMARGRDTGVPTLNVARRQFFAQTSHSGLQPYESWNDFQLGLRHSESLINFIAAYGAHPMITGESNFRAKRAAAEAIVTNLPVTLGAQTFDPPLDRHNFLNSVGPVWQSDAAGVTSTGLDDVDFWMGGLAEKTSPFGGMLGSTFNYVFETQMERLQDGDRFYYLTRLAGLNLLTELEGNSFAKIVMANTDVTRLPADIFSRPDFIIEAGDPSTWFIANDPATPQNEFRQHTSMQGDTLRFVGDEHVVMGGTPGVDKLRADIGDDSIWGEGGRDRIEGGAGNDQVDGGPGDDIVTDTFGDDNLKGGDGDDAINAGGGFDLLLPGLGKDFTVGGSDPKETFGGPGGDMIGAGDSADIVFGNEGDDWIEGGDQADLLQGGNGDPFQVDTQTGDDVINGQSGNDDYDSEGGDDILVTGSGTERLEGMLGFDWAAHKGYNQPADADLERKVFVRPDEDNVRDRFDLVEGLSGWNHNDILRGESLPTPAGNELTNPALIDGLQDVLGAGVTSFTGGNIILGGDGSDLIEGRGGNDLIDGDRWLDVQLESPDPATPSTTDTKRVDGMAALQADVFAGKIDPGAITIRRSIKTSVSGPTDVDTAVFSDVRANYEVIPSAVDPEVVTVIHLGGAGIDGTDTLRNVERAQFSDQTIEIVDIPTNTPATGAPAIDDTTPTEGQLLTASLGTVADLDNITPGTLAYAWQAELDPGVWTTIGSGATFTPGALEVGLALRVVVSFIDGDGVQESANSAATAAVENLNDAPTGAPILDDTTPTVGVQILSNTTQIGDLDGLAAAVFTHQWQTSVDGNEPWTPIAGATGTTFTPQAAQVGLHLRDLVSYTDDQGTNESVASAATAVVAAAPPPPPSLTAPSARVLRLVNPLVPRRMTAGAIVAKGVTVKFTAPTRTTLVRVRVFRVGSKSLLAKALIKAKHGRVTVVLKHPAIVRALKGGGTFRIEMTPGVSKSQWGATTVRKITVKR